MDILPICDRLRAGTTQRSGRRLPRGSQAESRFRTGTTRAASSTSARERHHCRHLHCPSILNLMVVTYPSSSCRPFLNPAIAFHLAGRCRTPLFVGNYGMVARLRHVQTLHQASPTNHTAFHQTVRAHRPQPQKSWTTAHVLPHSSEAAPNLRPTAPHVTLRQLRVAAAHSPRWVVARAAAYGGHQFIVRLGAWPTARGLPLQ